MRDAVFLLCLLGTVAACGDDDDDAAADGDADADTDADGDADADADTDADTDADADADGDADACPAAPPADAAGCDPPGAQCTYQDCDGAGVSRAFCQDGAWDVTVEACGPVTCGGAGDTCLPGQVCRERASGAQLVECRDNPCGDGPLTCDCAASLCVEGDGCSISDLTVQCDSHCDKCP